MDTGYICRNKDNAIANSLLMRRLDEDENEADEGRFVITINTVSINEEEEWGVGGWGWGWGAGERGAERDIDREYLVSCLLYTSPSPRDRHASRMPSSA